MKVRGAREAGGGDRKNGKGVRCLSLLDLLLRPDQLRPRLLASRSRAALCELVGFDEVFFRFLELECADYAGCEF